MIFRAGKLYSFLFLISISLVVASCTQVNVYEKNTPIPHYKWKHDFAATGSFVIKDTASAYNLYIVLRHTDAYSYNNIWLKVGLQAPGDTMFYQQVNLTLATDATGWEGSGMNDIWEVRKLLTGEPRRFRKGGEYKFSISQVMRDEPLAAVMSAGMRVQKTE